MLSRLCLFTILFTIMSACGSAQNAQQNPAHNALTKKEIREGWMLMFDGKTKNGWHVYNNSTDGSAWKVVDGTLMLDPKAKGPNNAGGGDLIFEDDFENFHLKLEWKLEKGGNSGIIFQALEDKRFRWPWQTGPEMQILDDDNHPDGQIKTHRSGDLYDMISANSSKLNPIGEWNLFEIKAYNGRLEFYMNGTRVVQVNQWDDGWYELIEKSKFKSLPDFGRHKKGKIALQDHGDPVWFRNIKIRRL